jgi:hypothetical protein
MSMFKQIFSDFLKLNDVDVSMGHHRINEFVGFLSNQNYLKFTEEYEKLQWDEQSILVDGIALRDDYEALVRQWLINNSSSYIAQLLVGVNNTFVAWQKRSAALGSAVSNKAANAFFEYLEAAFENLQNSYNLNPNHVETYGRIIRVLMGLQADEETTLSWFNASKEIEPNHLYTHLFMINYLAPKWHGSKEKMGDFAMKYGSDKRSVLSVLQIFDMIEDWLNHKLQGNDKAHRNYFNDPVIKSSVLDLYHNLDHRMKYKYALPVILNYFSFALYMIGEKDLARKEIKNIKGKLREYPWSYKEVINNKQLQNL